MQFIANTFQMLKKEFNNAFAHRPAGPCGFSKTAALHPFGPILNWPWFSPPAGETRRWATQNTTNRQ